jgi:hypothetical protein
MSHQMSAFGASPNLFYQFSPMQQPIHHPFPPYQMVHPFIGQNYMNMNRFPQMMTG